MKIFRYVSVPLVALGAAIAVSGASGATVQTAQGASGEFLVDSQGHALYAFDADSDGTSHCAGACSQTWPPLAAPSGASATAGGDAQSALLGSITRSDGSLQVTYKGLPLYTYAPDSAPGDTKGQGLASFGAAWWLVRPDGTKLKPSAGPSGGSVVNCGNFDQCDQLKCCDHCGNCHYFGLNCGEYDLCDPQKCCNHCGDCHYFGFIGGSSGSSGVGSAPQ